MKFLLALIACAVLFVLFSPLLLLLVLVALPFLWLLSIPFRIAAIALEALLAFFHAVLLLPARILGFRA